jgi:hypothetical protein
MPFTTGRWEAYTQHTDGTEYVISPIAVSGTTGLTKVAAGDYAVTLGNSITSVLVYKFPAIIRTGEPHLESTLLTSQALTGPQYEEYNPPIGPPFTIPGPVAGQTLPVLKGVRLKSVDLIYLLAGAAATTNTVGIFVKQDANNAAPTITTLLAQAANGLQTATQTARYVTNVPIAVATRGFTVTPDTVITVEWDLTTASGGTAQVFGVVFNYDFNLN